MIAHDKSTMTGVLSGEVQPRGDNEGEKIQKRGFPTFMGSKFFHSENDNINFYGSHITSPLIPSRVKI